jgi:SAM-dependent methyltransferase
MKRDFSAPPPDRSLRLGLDWRWHRPKRRDPLPKGEPRNEERPLRCESNGTIVSAPARNLPFADNHFDFVDCGTVFAYVRNDEALTNELARIVSPGGIVHLRVPADGPLAGLDAFNIHRYLVDITKRGLRPFETADIGWRRHYGESDIAHMFGRECFTVVEFRRSGLAASEAVRMSGFVLFRWWRASRNGYRRVSRLAEYVLDYEDDIVWKHGFWLEATVRRNERAVRNESEPR